jgi:hypothetical protein
VEIQITGLFAEGKVDLQAERVVPAAVAAGWKNRADPW